VLDERWLWKPNSSVGVIKLGDNISHYVDSLDLKIWDEEADETGWVDYKIPKVDTYISTQNGVVRSISSYEVFTYNETNLIGLKLEDLYQILNCKPDEIGTPVIYEDGDIQIPYEYFELGLELWISDGKVVLASCIKLI